VIIGGGSIGCNTAYHLTKLGMMDVVVLEQGQLTSGTTWHAAGLIVAGLLKSEAECEIHAHGRDLYANLEQETGISTGFRAVGYLQIASNEERVHEMRRVAPFMRRHGINMYEIATKEAGARTAEVCRRHGISEQTFYRDALLAVEPAARAQVGGRHAPADGAG
jgi:4-methylaminobutanoate oxidase (formaldehyde-forming)